MSKRHLLRDAGIYLCIHKCSSSSDFIRGNDRQKGQRAALFTPPMKNSLMVATVIKTRGYLGLGPQGHYCFRFAWGQMAETVVFFLSISVARLVFYCPSTRLGQVLSNFRAGENTPSPSQWLARRERNKRRHGPVPCPHPAVSVTAFLRDYNSAVD